MSGGRARCRARAASCRGVCGPLWGRWSQLRRSGRGCGVCVVVWWLVVACGVHVVRAVGASGG
eukprot:9696905-Lingulodinium_polyedra.AAC.1